MKHQNNLQNLMKVDSSFLFLVGCFLASVVCFIVEIILILFLVPQMLSENLVTKQNSTKLKSNRNKKTVGNM